MKKLLWILFAVGAIGIGLYPFTYFVIDRRFGLLGTKTAELLADTIWNTAFYAHILIGGIALLVGWIQFSKKLRVNKPKIHRQIGKVYVITVLISGMAGVYIALHATGGIWPMLGFLGLALVWLLTTIFAFTAIKKGNVSQHQNLMIYSYAACFGAVTLRIWLPILTEVMGGFYNAYPLVAWIAWVPNIVVAYFIVRANNRKLTRAKTA